MKKFFIYTFIALALNSVSQTEISARYDHIGSFRNGYAVVELNGKKGMINTQGKETIKPEWDNLSGFGSDGVGFARKNYLVGLINREGVIIAEPVYSHISNFNNGRAVVTKDFMKGIIDISGKIIVEPKYQKLKVEEGGVIRATIDGKEVLLKAE